MIKVGLLSFFGGCMQREERPIDPRSGDNTSDHTYQSVMVQLTDDKEKNLMSLRGATWNLLNRCESAKTNKRGISNNPWHMDETPLEYISRKEKQMAKIIQILSDPQQGQKDFMLLQEIDIFIARIKGFSSDEMNKLTVLRADFQTNLQKIGYALITPEYINGFVQQPAAIIFKKNVLELVNGTERGVLPNDENAHRAFEAEFKHIKTGKLVTLVSLHLDYTHDYSVQIPGFQEMKTAMDKFTIMGGDTNHAPNHQITGFINNWNNITNVNGYAENDKITLTGNHKDNEAVKKCYDGFFVNPTSTTKVIVVEQKSEVFTKNKLGDWLVRSLNPATEYKNHYIHHSPVGIAWSRGAEVPTKANNFSTSTANHAVMFPTAKPEAPVKIYLARRGGLAIQFPTPVMRDAFVNEIGSGKLPESTRKFEGNTTCPLVYDLKPDTVYFPFCKTDNDISILFPNNEMRDKTNQLLGLTGIGKAELHNTDAEIKLLNVAKKLETQLTTIEFTLTKELKAVAENSIHPTLR
jgi:hypothetical protein